MFTIIAAGNGHTDIAMWICIGVAVFGGLHITKRSSHLREENRHL